MGGSLEESSTQRAFGVHIVLGFALIVLGHDDLFVMAFLPARMPDRAASAEPVHMVMTCLTFGAVLRMESSVAFNNGFRHPGPPGMMRMSNSGAVSKV